GVRVPGPRAFLDPGRLRELVPGHTTSRATAVAAEAPRRPEPAGTGRRRRSSGPAGVPGAARKAGAARRAGPAGVGRAALRGAVVGRVGVARVAVVVEGLRLVHRARTVPGVHRP